MARSSYWSLPVGRYLSNSRCKGSVMTREVNCEQYGRRAAVVYRRLGSGKQPVVPLSDFHIDTWRVDGIKIIRDHPHSRDSRRGGLCSAHVSNCIKTRAHVLCGGPCFAPIHQNWHNVCLIEA